MPPEDYWPPDLPEPVTYRGPVAAPTEEPPAPEVPVEYSNSAGDFGQPYTGLPVIVEGNQASYNGVPMSEAAAFQARQADAANPQRQAAFQQAEQQRAAIQAESPGGNAEPTSIQLRAEMDRNQLSRADQVELTQIQNGIARLNRDAREGRVPLTQAQQLVQALEGRANPLMVRSSTARALERLLEYQTHRERFEQQSRLNARAATFWAANAPGAQIEHRDNDGRVFARSIVGLDGGLHTINNPEPRPVRETPQITPQIMAQFVRAADSQQVNELRDTRRRGQPDPPWAANTPEGLRLRETDAQRRINGMVERHSGGGGPTRSDAASQEEALTGLANSVINRVLPRVAPRQPAPAQDNNSNVPLGDPNSGGSSLFRPSE